jgi:FKBP-type peptidyl-prolyl cis-trans isomerase
MKTKIGTMVIVLVVLILPFGLTSCLDSNQPVDPQITLEQDIAAIDAYLTSNNITNVVKDPTGIRMVITELGTGFPAHTYNTIDVDYVGKLFSDGTTFDDGNIKAGLSSLIMGWRFAFIILPAGSKATIYIPSGWGYGDEAKPGIPANSILVFDVTFNKVVISTTDQEKLKSDTTAIDNYLSTKGIVAEKDTTGLRYVVTQMGGGATPSWYTKVKISGDIRLLTDDTKIVHTMNYEPKENFYSRVVDQMPDGIKQILLNMPVGSKVTLYLASSLAWGPLSMSADGTGPVIIPANSNVIIDLDFTEIVTP